VALDGWAVSGMRGRGVNDTIRLTGGHERLKKFQISFNPFP
jgi:hypothetical protein